jgi:protein arginine N-methyltransferase 1
VYDRFTLGDARNRWYGRAVRDAAPGRVVLDIGTGRDALWALAAARAGARHVYAVESDPTAAEQARQAVARAGLTGSVTVLEGHSTRISLPVTAQVCVSEIVGNIASAEGMMAVLGDARDRLTTPDCTWIPYRCRTRVAAVDLHRSAVPHRYALAEASLPYLAAVFTSVGYPFDVRLCLAGPVVPALISAAGTLESLIFDGSGDDPAEPGDLDLVVEVPTARLTGVLLWPTVLCRRDQPEIDALAGDTRGWAPVYAPLSVDGTPVRRGDRVRLAFTRTTSDDGVHPDYRLAARVLGRAGPPREAGQWNGAHHDPAFRAGPGYQQMFLAGNA